MLFGITLALSKGSEDLAFSMQIPANQGCRETLSLRSSPVALSGSALRSPNRHLTVRSLHFAHPN